MITAAILAAVLAAGTALAGDAASSAAPVSANAGDEKISLTLRDADLKNLLEKLATLMDVTPIIAPGVGGTVTMSVNAPVPEILRSLERDFQITIRVADGRMLVSKASSSPLPLDDDAADSRYLGDSTLPRRPAAAAPKRFEGAVEFTNGAGQAFVYSLVAPGTISISGCPTGLLMFATPGDRFDGLPGLILKSEGAIPRPANPGVTLKGDLPRLLSPSLGEAVSVDVPGCSAPLSVRLLGSNAGAVAPLPLPPFGQFRIQLQVLEVSGQGATVLSAPRLQVLGGEPAMIQSGTSRRSATGLVLGQTVQAAIVVTDASDKTATIAVTAAVQRDVDPKDGGALLTIRVAHARESARLAYGKSQRIVLAPTFGRGDSALVLDLVIERVPPKN